MTNVDTGTEKSAQQKKIVILTNLFPLPWEPNRGAFNKQQFSRLEERYQCLYIIPVPIQTWLKHKTRDANASNTTKRLAFFIYIPKIARGLYGLFLYLSIILHSGLALFRFKPDLLIASWAYPEGYSGALIAKLLGIPYLIKVHGSDINELLDNGSRGRQIIRAMNGSSGIISVSQALKQKLTDRGVTADKIKVIYNGVDKDIFNTNEPPTQLTQDAPFVAGEYLIYVGNSKATKGIFELFEGFRQTALKYSNLHLLIIGDGPDKAKLQQLVAASEISGRVTFLSSIPISLVANWVKSSKALLLPSYNEGVPNVVLEAKACGIPVIATTVGGIPEVFEEGVDGFLIPPKDADALATAIDKLMAADWDQHRISENAKEFCWDRNIQQLTSMIEKNFD